MEDDERVFRSIVLLLLDAPFVEWLVVLNAKEGLAASFVCGPPSAQSP